MKTKSAQEILVLGTKKRTASQLRRALGETGREYQCERCLVGSEWQGEFLTIEIHHKDGNPLNNCESNLQYLCPNCHSLTPNFYHTKRQTFCACGKPKTHKGKQCRSCANKNNHSPKLTLRKVVRPTKEELAKLLWEQPTTKIAESLGVTDKAISKWCKSYGLTKPPRGYWTNVSRLEGGVISPVS